MMRLIVAIFFFNSISLFAQENLIEDGNQQFIKYLENTLENDVVNAQTTEIFYQRSWAYWGSNLEDYILNPEKYDRVLSLYHQSQQKFKQESPIDIERYEDEIENFRRFDNRNTLAKNSILFIGSSSIRYWETSKAFPDLPIINRGFGGASIPEIIYYYDDIIKKHSPSILIVYCDIDVEQGKSPSSTVDAFKELVNKVKTDFPQTQILILSMKSTFIDEILGKDVRKNKIITNDKLNEYCNDEKNLHFVDITNTMLNSDGGLRSDIFLSDGMHMNPLGYTLWNPVIRKEINGLSKQKE